MELLNFYLAALFSCYGCISALKCLTCDECDKNIKDYANCSVNHIYCISYGGNKLLKRCGTREECERVMNHSPNPSEYMESHRSFVDGLMEFDVAAMVATTFSRYDYCCDSDLCYSQSMRMLKEGPSGVTRLLDDVTEETDSDGNSKVTTVGDITSTGNSQEKYFEYETTLRHPRHKRRHTGYNAPKLRSKSDSYTTLPINKDGFSEKRSRKRSPVDDVEETSENAADLNKGEKIVSVSREEETTSESIYTITSASSTDALDNSTGTESSNDQENAEPVSKGIRLHNFGMYILVPFSILFIFW